MAETRTLRDAFIDELRDAYAEKQLIKALPKMARAANADALREAIETHLRETEEHATRLERVFGSIDEKARGKPGAGMAGIIAEGQSVLEEDLDEATLDACLIAAAQRAEHHEIAAYGTLVAWVKAMGHDDAAALLHETLEEEKAADETLTSLADRGLSQEAAEVPHPDDADEANGGTAQSKGGSPRASTA